MYVLITFIHFSFYLEIHFEKINSYFRWYTNRKLFLLKRVPQRLGNLKYKIDDSYLAVINQLYSPYQLLNINNFCKGNFSYFSPLKFFFSLYLDNLWNRDNYKQ